MKGYAERQKTLFTRKTYTWFSNMKARAKGTFLSFTLAEFRGHVAICFCIIEHPTADNPPVCILCGNRVTLETAVMAHLVPLKRGGTWDLGNLWPAHDECNRIQGELLIAEYSLLMQLLRTFPEKARVNILTRLKTAGGFARLRYFPKGKPDGRNRKSRVLPTNAQGTDAVGLFPKAQQ